MKLQIDRTKRNSFLIEDISHIMARLYLIFLLLLCFWIDLAVANSSKGQVKNKCNKTESQIFETPTCILCALNAFLTRCPARSLKITRGIGLRKCILGSNLYGCVHLCRRRVVRRVCCRGYWGPDCQPCPGLESGKPACFGNGRCNDKDNGNGTCRCNAGFEGFACELCTNKTKFGAKCHIDCTCKHGECDNGALGTGTCAPFSCKIGYHGSNCEKFEPNCSNPKCHSHSHCYEKKCKCNPGYSGNGIYCKEIDPCNLSNNLCPGNAVCKKTGPGHHKCVCGPGYRGDGVICTAIDPCQERNGFNCSQNARCNYVSPGNATCLCLPGYDSYDAVKGCSIINLCIDQDCPAINSECAMIAPGQKKCRCKSGYTGNGTVCYGSIIQRIDDLHSSGMYKGKFRHVKNVIKQHSDLTLAFTARGPFTLFLPTDDGLEAKLTSQQLDYIIQNKEMVHDLILVHTASAYLPTSSLNNNGNLTTMKGWDAVVANDGGLHFQLAGRIEKPNITEPDIIAWNGMIHVINEPIWTPDFTNLTNTSSKTLWHVIAERSDLSAFREFIQMADLESEFRATSTNDRTVIAPINEAFAKLGRNKTEFLKSTKGKAKLQAIIRHHIFGLKIGVFDLRYKSSLMSLAPELVRVNVTNKGALVLEGESKLIENNVLTTNGYLHLTDTVLLPSIVLPIVQKHCDDNDTKIVYSPCRGCSLSFINGNCPQGTVTTGVTVRCLIRINFRIGSRIFRGCKSECAPSVKKCCPGFYGSSCAPCPGPVGNACFGNGKCSDGVSGTGQCNCHAPFKGTACELCKDKDKFGLNCSESCTCVHGLCDNGRSGSGLCVPNSCISGFNGTNCAFKLQSCILGWKLYTETCHVNSTLFCQNSKPVCVCNRGYKPLGKNCYEIDPCLEDNRGGCDKNAVCTKTAPGQNKCTCLVGWTGDGTYCTPIDYCTKPSGVRCHRNAKCTSLGVMKCECNPGYAGDGWSCQEINSCLINNGNCPSLARCIKTGPGTNKCTCTVGHLLLDNSCLPSLSLVIQRRKELKKMSSLMVKYNLVRYLAADQNMTAFLPSDDAMSNLDANATKLLDSANNVFFFGGSNTALGIYSLSYLRNKNTEMLPSLFANVNITINHTLSGEPLVGGIAKIVVANISASNGVLHIVDTVLLPPFLRKPRVEPSLFQGLCHSKTIFREMCKFIAKFGLKKKLKSCNHCTVFVPTNKAFDHLDFHQYRNIRSTDILYHMTNHTLWTNTIVNGQQFASLAGNFYRLSLEREKKQLKVNGVDMTFYKSSSKWVIYTIPKVLQAARNTCFKTLKVVTKTRCRPCRFTSLRCGARSRYAGKEDCLYQVFGSYFVGCRAICEVPVKVRDCCTGFYGKDCFACPGHNGKPCFGNGVCHDSRTGTGNCKCNETFSGFACERCISGYFGQTCKSCKCQGKATCDQRNGHCICPDDKKGLQCESPARNETCVNTFGNTTVTCDKHANCSQNETKNAICKCDNGFKGNGTHCERIDLCAKDVQNCSPDATCHYNGTHRTCKCNQNFDGDGFFCRGKNPCVSGDLHCLKRADCLYLRPGRSVCKCKAGFSGDGERNCEAISPCPQDNGGCSFFAKCSFNNNTLKTTCTCNDGYIGDGMNCTGDIWESLISYPELSEFRSRLKKWSMKDILSPEIQFSVIAPTNNAFSSSRRKRRSAETLSDSDLGHYIISCVALSERDVKTPNKSFVSVAGSLVHITSSKVINTNVNVRSVIITANSAVLVVNRLLDVPDDNKNSLDNMTLTEVAKSKGYQKFVQLLTDADLLDIESDIYHRPLTLFWPTDKAFSLLPDDIQKRLKDKINEKDYIRDIVNYHIVQKTKVFTKDILSYSGGLVRRSREGSPLYISCKGHQGDLYVDGRSKIVERDIGYQGGIAFGISEVLLPPGVAGRCDEIKYERVKGSCMACSDNGFCPSGTILVSVDKNASCLYNGTYVGCSSSCIKRIKVKKCCKNFYGPDCQECPGGLNPCSGRGTCDDGLHSNGTCTCLKPFTGLNCEICPTAELDCSGKIIHKLCTSRDNPCSIHATCDTSRSKLCQCYPGYEGSGYYCQAIDKCQRNNGGCSKHAICRYTGPNSNSCECRFGYIGDGVTCTALYPSHPCVINNGDCHTHARCTDKDGAASCRCRSNFVGNGIFCAGSAKDVIYDIEDLSEFAKTLKQLSFGVEGHTLLRQLSSEKEFTVFVPINYAFNSHGMNIDQVKNHIVGQRISFERGTKRFLSLAHTNITIVITGREQIKIRLNNFAIVLYQYPATNGMVVVIDHTLPYIKPPRPPSTPPKPVRPTMPTNNEGLAKASRGNEMSAGVISGITVGVVVAVLIISIGIFFVRKRRSGGVKYNRNFENVLLQSEPYTEDEDIGNEDDYEHQELQHPSSEMKETTLQNPTYIGNDADIQNDVLEMTETSNIVPLTEYDATSF